MSRKQLVFCLICVLLWPAAIFVDDLVKSYTSWLLWWMSVQTAATDLTQRGFFLHFLLPLSALDGFLLGLIPIHRLRTWAANAFGHLRYHEKTRPEFDASRPVLWAWVLPTAFFLLFFFLWRPAAGHSVFGDSSSVGNRLDYFFGSTVSYVQPSENNLIWSNKRIFCTLPMLFLLAYAGAVWLRHHLPARPLAHFASEDEPSPLIHSTPDLNLTEPTEITAQHGSPE